MSSNLDSMQLSPEFCSIYGYEVPLGNCLLIVLKGRATWIIKGRLWRCTPRSIVIIDLDNGRPTVIPIAEIKTFQIIPCPEQREMQKRQGGRDVQAGDA